jgi:hypothetical protein
MLVSDSSFTFGHRQKSRSKEGVLNGDDQDDADCLRLLPNRRLGPFHRLRDLHHRRSCFRMSFELSQVLSGPGIADKGLLFRHDFHSSLIRIDVAIVAARAERFD